LKVTEVAPVKFVPLIVTFVPTVPLVGENELTVGALPPLDVTVNDDEFVPVPPGVVTAILPVVAPLGTWALMSVAELTTKVVSATPLNVTLVAPVKFVPWMSTAVPTGPLCGENDVTVGALPPPPPGANAAVPFGVPSPDGPS
jgi:hypothetical protein